MFAIPAVVMEEQLGSYFFSPSLSDDESHCSNMLSQFSTYGHNQAVPGCRQGGRTRQWSWASAEKKKILNWLAVGERTERLLKVRALQKMLGSTSKESLLLFHHASSLGRWDPGGKYSLEMPSSNVSWGIRPFYSRFSEEIRIKYASCQPRQKCTGTVSSHRSCQCLQVKEKWLLLFWIYFLWRHLFLPTKWNHLFIQTN